MNSISDAQIVLVEALSLASRLTAEQAQEYLDEGVPLNWTTAGLLADVLDRDVVLETGKVSLSAREEIRYGLMLLTQPQWSAIIRSTAKGESAALVERVKQDGRFPDSWE